MITKNTHNPGLFCPILTEMAKESVDVQNLMEDLGTAQCTVLEYWLEHNGIKDIKIKSGKVTARISGMVTIEHVRVCEISIELIMWDKAKQSYSQDYAEFLRERAKGDTKGGEKE